MSLEQELVLLFVFFFYVSAGVGVCVVFGLLPYDSIDNSVTFARGREVGVELSIEISKYLPGTLLDEGQSQSRNQNTSEQCVAAWGAE